MFRSLPFETGSRHEESSLSPKVCKPDVVKMRKGPIGAVHGMGVEPSIVRTHFEREQNLIIIISLKHIDLTADAIYEMKSLTSPVSPRLIINDSNITYEASQGINIDNAHQFFFLTCQRPVCR